METTKVVTKAVKGTNGQFVVFRGTTRIGAVKMLHRGWEASFCGVRTVHATKALAIAELAAR